MVCKVLDAMRLDGAAKVQIHVGGVYGNKIEALTRFVRTYDELDNVIRRKFDKVYSYALRYLIPYSPNKPNH